MSNRAQNNTTITNNNNNDNNKRWQSKIPNQHQQQEKDNKPKSIKDNLTLKLRQKQRDIEQLGIDPAEILEEEEKIYCVITKENLFTMVSLDLFLE
jgi:hypothetical protein